MGAWRHACCNTVKEAIVMYNIHFIEVVAEFLAGTNFSEMSLVDKTLKLVPANNSILEVFVASCKQKRLYKSKTHSADKKVMSSSTRNKGVSHV